MRVEVHVGEGLQEVYELLSPTGFVFPFPSWDTHPKTFKASVATVRATAETRGEELLVDCFPFEEVIVHRLGNVSAPLTSHPEFKRWSTGLSAGEFWASIGEDWVGASGDDSSA